jgi:hypothetical protein
MKNFAEEGRPRFFIAFVHVSLSTISAHSFSKCRLLLFDVSLLINTLLYIERNWHVVVNPFEKASNFKFVLCSQKLHSSDGE